MSVRIGQRVTILGNNQHPWAGSTGIVVEAFDGHPQLDWTVELDDGTYPGHQVAVSEDEIRES